MLGWKNHSALSVLSGISLLTLFGFASPASAQSNNQCQKEITLQSVEVLDGQGIGEGKLEMEITSEIGNLNQRTERAWKVAPGNVHDLSVSFPPIKIDPGSSVQLPLRSTVVEHEVGADQFVGGNDQGTTANPITLQCGGSRLVEQDVVVYGKNNARVRLTYDIKDAQIRQTQQSLSPHSVVIDSSNDPGSTDYTINASGNIQQVSGTIAGHSVSIQDNDNVSGNSAEGAVSSGADGFYVMGSVPKIQLENSDAATVYIDGKKAGRQQQETIKLTQLSSEARWESGRLVSDNNATNTQELPWMGSPSDEQGFVRLDEVTLENGQTTTALRTHPKWVSNGTIKGWHPWVELPENDPVFSADVGFVQGARNTDGVTFQVWEHHKEGGRTVWNKIAEVDKEYTGNLKHIEADLSHLAGQEVKIELRVDAGESSGQDWAVWNNVKIQ
jgi:hypothetical protein